MEDLFEGSTINTPSMLCLEDYMDALAFVETLGGLKGAMARADANAKVIADWVARTPWVDFVAADPATRSNTSVCLKVVDPEVTALSPKSRDDFPRRMTARLEQEGVAYDIAAYRAAPPGLRVWTGSTVETPTSKPDAVARLGLRVRETGLGQSGLSVRGNARFLAGLAL
ncbi:hypothetical protein AUC71_16495 [Methyloceanibacter marginalis]|uniref:Uncharacterized protein n=1 Tax=Methyloceanibacter marginalis TaxID=1774971 RepID=A0A1E3WAU2_9HYPH|nr:hypothetical protein AUC71_16495 [Methyloceanibacter marginalis]